MATTVVPRRQDYDYLYKFVLIGDSGVGKSCLLLRFADDVFTESFITTIGVDFRFRTVVIGSKRVKLQLWDTAGQERFRTITSAYYRGADGVVVVYDVSQRESFDHVTEWVTELRRHALTDVPLIFVGNKSDRTDRAVSEAEGAALAASLGALFMETSARTAERVETMFSALAKRCMEATVAADAAKQRADKGVSLQPEGRSASASASASVFAVRCCGGGASR